MKKYKSSTIVAVFFVAISYCFNWYQPDDTDKLILGTWHFKKLVTRGYSNQFKKWMTGITDSTNKDSTYITFYENSTYKRRSDSGLYSLDGNVCTLIKHPKEVFTIKKISKDSLVYDEVERSDYEGKIVWEITLAK